MLKTGCARECVFMEFGSLLQDIEGGVNQGKRGTELGTERGEKSKKCRKKITKEAEGIELLLLSRCYDAYCTHLQNLAFE